MTVYKYNLYQLSDIFKPNACPGRKIECTGTMGTCVGHVGDVCARDELS